jgi:hypothetical protein
MKRVRALTAHGNTDASARFHGKSPAPAVPPATAGPKSRVESVIARDWFPAMFSSPPLTSPPPPARVAP